MSGQKEIERRHTNRTTLRDLRLTEKDTGELVGKLVNLSFGGMLVNSPTPFNEDDSYQFRIPFDNPLLGEEHLDIDAKCIWCNNDINPAIYSVGFMFPIESSNKVIIIDQINENFRSTHINTP